MRIYPGTLGALAAAAEGADTVNELLAEFGLSFGAIPVFVDGGAAPDFDGRTYIANIVFDEDGHAFVESIED